jgi:hypothetical protein
MPHRPAQYHRASHHQAKEKNHIQETKKKETVEKGEATNYKYQKRKSTFPISPTHRSSSSPTSKLPTRAYDPTPMVIAAMTEHARTNSK